MGNCTGIDSRKYYIAMPWTIGDVDGFKQGLTDKQKRQWVRIANNALRKCTANGGSDCDASAVRQANGAVKTNLRSIFSTHSEYVVRREVHQNKTHIVVPVTLMVEGVHNGNHGPLYHPVEELGSAADAWNGQPVTISHPKSGGEYVSASLPGILTRYGVGNIFDVHLDGDRLRGEAWIDEQKLKEKSPEAHRRIEKGEPLEVSAGLFSEDEMIGGTWNEESYTAISRNHKPDHLALLPGEVGACSWDDGCGVRANQKGGKSMPNNDEHLDKETHLENLLNNKETGYREVISNIQEKLNAMDTDMRLYFLTDVYDDFFVYEVRSREGGAGPKMYKRDYTVNEDDSIVFAEEPAEVRKKVTYVNLSSEGLKRTNINPKKEVKMPDVKKPCDGCEALVDTLIANEKTPFEDKDKERLLEMSEEQVTGLITAYAEKKEVKKEPEPKKEEPSKEVKANAGEGKTKEPQKFETAEDFLETVPPAFKEHFSSGLRLHAEKREGMVKAVLANTDEGVWTEAQLKEMEIETLESVYKSIINEKQVADYSLGADSPKVHSGGIAPLMRLKSSNKA